MDRVDGLTFAARRHGSTAETPQQLRCSIEQSHENDKQDLTELTALLADTSIWLPAELYAMMPVLLPHVLRDNHCRKQSCRAGHKKKLKGNIGDPRDLWSTPSPEGYVRDDNSLVKMLCKNLRIVSSNTLLHGAQMGTNWVACHIWPMSTASDPWLNSFVPNLVWLPKPLDVLSDREGHPLQQMLRRTSLDYFNTHEVAAPDLTRDLLGSLKLHPTDAAKFEVRNTFSVNASWRNRRWEKVGAVTQILEAVTNGESRSRRSGHSHYDSHVSELDPRTVAPLATRLRDYIDTALNPAS